MGTSTTTSATGRTARRFVDPDDLICPAAARRCAALVVDVETSESVYVKYSLVRSASANAEEFSNLQYHFETLKLAGHYEREANVEIFDRIDSINSYFTAGGPDALESYLRLEARSAQASRGRNYWRSALWLGLSRSRAFCEGAFEQLLK